VDARRSLGDRGEAAAAAWYEANGYEVLARNWRCRLGEIDLIVKRGHLVAFCEVKTRASQAFGHPVEAVTREKRDRVRHLAARWLQDTPVRPGIIRFDVVAVQGDRTEVVEGAF
jgi:putative endonuclease